MLNTFYYKDGNLWRWYVLNDSHVLDEGVAKTIKGAENKAKTSKMIIGFALDGEIHDA